MAEQTHAEEIRSIRALQRDAQQSGGAPSFQDARALNEQTNAANRGKEVIKGVGDAAIAKLEAKIADLEKQLLGLRITGPGFSGEGPEGIMFNPAETTQEDTTADTPDEEMTGFVCISGTSTEIVVKARLA